MKYLRFAVALATLALAATFAQAEVKLAPWSEEVYVQVEKEYGALAAQRLRKLYDVIQATKDKPLREKLETTNDVLNRLPWVTDQSKWNADDYWATPLESLTQFGGDCEDIAIGKYVMLRLMGVPRKNLYLGYGKLRTTGEFHMVLVWVNDNRSQSLVLDNFERAIKSGKERTDLLGIYMTDAAGNVLLLHDEGGKRSVKNELSERKLQKLQGVKQKMAETRERYKQYNNGRPILEE